MLAQAQLQPLPGLPELGRLFLTHGPDRGVVVGLHLRGGGEILLQALPVAKVRDHGFEAGVFPRQVTEAVLVADDVRIGKQARNLLEAVPGVFQFFDDGCFH